MRQVCIFFPLLVAKSSASKLIFTWNNNKIIDIGKLVFSYGKLGEIAKKKNHNSLNNQIHTLSSIFSSYFFLSSLYNQINFSFFSGYFTNKPFSYSSRTNDLLMATKASTKALNMITFEIVCLIGWNCGCMIFGLRFML